jgi:tetratricopeptide (TPR) repeat protein
MHNLAYEYEKRGEHQKAFELYHQALALEDNNRLILSLPHIKIAEHLERRGELDKAAEHLDQALAIFPAFEKVQLQQALTRFKAGRLELALTAIQPLVAKRSESFDCNHLMAQILLKMGNIQDALHYLRHCLKLLPDSAAAAFMMGIARNLDENGMPAEQILRLIVKLLEDGFVPETAREQLAQRIVTQAQSKRREGKPATIEGDGQAGRAEGCETSWNLHSRR